MLRRAALVSCFLIFLLSLRAQTLAHPGWRGNGIASQAWWKHASFVRFGPDTTFAAALHDLDAMSDAGIDSMVLPDLQPVNGDPLPFNPRFGTEDELDTLLREASARHMHVLLSIPMARLSVGDNEVRFWMSRGIAGLDVGTVSTGDLSVLRGVRSAMARFAGERILIGSVAAATASTRADLRRDPLTLHLAPASGAATTSRQSAQPWQAFEVASLDAPSPSIDSNTVMLFDAKLLEQPDGPENIHRRLAGRGRRPPRRR